MSRRISVQLLLRSALSWCQSFKVQAVIGDLYWVSLLRGKLGGQRRRIL